MVDVYLFSRSGPLLTHIAKDSRHAMDGYQPLCKLYFCLHSAYPPLNLYGGRNAKIRVCQTAAILMFEPSTYLGKQNILEAARLVLVEV